jgi:single-stranded-DNA-specific exonuclease
MDEIVLPPKLFSHLSQAADIVRNHDFIQIFSHYDADGISAAAIVAKALLREKKEFRVTLFTTLNDPNMEVIKSTVAECMIITDLGASYIKEFDAMDCDVIVLDHHTICDQAKRICYANPHLYNIDGMTSGCGATMALLFAVALNEKNWDLVQIAFAGIAGDRQHINGLSGLNTYLLSEGTKRGFIEVTDGSLIPIGELTAELFMSTDPYIRGVSGNVDGVARLLDDAGIEHTKHFKDLTDNEKRRLTSLMTVKLVQQGVSLQTLIEVSRTRYYLSEWKMDAEALSSLLNGCGRLGLMGVGVGAGMGDKDCLKKAKDIETESKKQTINGVLTIDKMGLTQMNNIQWFDSSTSGFTGMICGIAMQFIGDHRKPTIGINSSEGLAKVSSRGMWEQLDRGVDLSKALKIVCESVGGNGGGHKIASGGSFDPSKIQEFLNNLDKIIGEQQVNAK